MLFVMDLDVSTARNKYCKSGREASRAQGPDAPQFPEVFISAHGSHSYKDHEGSEACYALPWDTA